jgi:glycerol kinase
MRKAGAAAADISAIGITNQRETTLIWDRETGECVYNAIVWQDRRTADYCQSLKDDGLEAVVTEKTGLRLDPYFSGSWTTWTACALARKPGNSRSVRSTVSSYGG